MFFSTQMLFSHFPGCAMEGCLMDFWERNKHVWSEILLLPVFTEEDLSLMRGSTDRSCRTARVLLVRVGFLQSENKQNCMNLLSVVFTQSGSKKCNQFDSLLFGHFLSCFKYTEIFHRTKKKFIKVRSASILGSSERYI